MCPRSLARAKSIVPPGFPPTDQLANDSFDKVYRRGQMEVNSRLQAVQGRLKVAHSVALDMVMLLVKGSVEVRCDCRGKMLEGVAVVRVDVERCCAG